MIVFRHADPRFPFLWETADQPAARWHEEGEGPVHYFADTPDGAWAELIRHEEIRTPGDLEMLARALWAVELPDEPLDQALLPPATMTGGRDTYETCCTEARRLRAAGSRGFVAWSAALREGAAGGWRVRGGLERAPIRDGKVIVLFDRRPDLIGWPAVLEGRPDPDLLPRVRHLSESGA